MTTGPESPKARVEEMVLEGLYARIGKIDRGIVGMLRQRLDAVIAVARIKDLLGKNTEKEANRDEVLTDRDKEMQAVGYPAGTGRAIWTDIEDVTVAVGKAVRATKRTSVPRE